MICVSPGQGDEEADVLSPHSLSCSAWRQTLGNGGPTRCKELGYPDGENTHIRLQK